MKTIIEKDNERYEFFTVNGKNRVAHVQMFGFGRRDVETVSKEEGNALYIKLRSQGFKRI